MTGLDATPWLLLAIGLALALWGRRARRERERRRHGIAPKERR